MNPIYRAHFNPVKHGYTRSLGGDDLDCVNKNEFVE